MSITTVPVDLEDLAAGYGHRPTSGAGLARARRAGQAAALRPGDVAIDIGGGRGQHARVWREMGAVALVVDPARAMVLEAAALPGVRSIRGRAQQLPLRDNAVTLAYFHLSIHYGNWRAALAEAQRVLRPGGQCWIWTMGERHHRNSILARWFPSVGDIDAARFPDPVAIADHLRLTCRHVDAGQEVEMKARPSGEWRAAVAARFVSTLQLIPPEEFLAGLAAIDSRYQDPAEPIEYALTFDWIQATM